MYNVEENARKISLPEVYQCSFGVYSSPFLLNTTTRHHLECYRDSHSDLVQLLLDSYFVDDLTNGADSEEAHTMFVKTIIIWRNVDLTYENSPPILQHFSRKLMPLKTRSAVRALSPLWGRHIILGSTQPAAPQDHTSTKEPRYRSLEFQCLRHSSSSLRGGANQEEYGQHCRFYDMLRFLTPIVLRFKSLFSRTSVQTRWRSIIDGFFAGQMEFPRTGPSKDTRYYLDGIDGNSISFTLCGFCDTSIRAVVYLMIKTYCGVQVRFIVAKTRVSHELTIQRMELLSALRLVQLTTTVSNRFYHPTTWNTALISL